MENKKQYLRNIKGLGDMFENGNTRIRQQVADMIERRFDSGVADDIMSGKLQLRDNSLFDTVTIHDGGTTPIIVQTPEFYSESIGTTDKGFNNVKAGKVEKMSVWSGMMFEYGTKPVAVTKKAFIKGAVPAHILSGLIEYRYDGALLLELPLHHLAIPDENNNNLLNALRYDLNHVKVFEKDKVINAKIYLLNDVPAVAGQVQMLRFSSVVSEIVSNISQAQ